MEYCFLKGFLVVLLMQHSTAEDLSTSIQSSTAITLQEGQTLPQEQELPPAEVVPVVAPPSLKEVQQAVQEASEQVEGRGAEEVLKELLERVVEAALGQAEGGGEAKAGEAPEQGTVEEEMPGAAEGDVETDTGAEVLEQGVVKEVEGEDIGGKGGETGVEEVQEVAEVDASKDVAEVVKGVIEGEVETADESVGEVTAGVQAGDSEGEEGVEVINETPDTKVSQEVEEEAVAASVETGGNFVEDAGLENKEEQVMSLEENGAAEAETQEVEELPAAVEVAVNGEPEQETLVESDPSLAEQIGEVEALEGETKVDDIEGEVNVPSSDSYEMETTQTVDGEPVEEEEEEVNVVKDTVEPEVEDGPGHVAVEGAAEEMEPEGAGVVESEGGEQVVIKEDSVSINEGVGDQLTGEEEIVLETSHSSQTEDQEALVISAPEPERGADVSVEQSPENQAPTQSPSLGEVETGENQKSEHGNEIITPTDEALPNDPVVAQPTLDHFVKDVAEHPQAEVEEPGQANELVEDAAGSTEMTELGLDAWKIGAISAAVFLVLETVIIIIYILKCRNKNSTLALQRACEEGCVEPEAATGGDCSDDTLPAGNGDTQQVITLDPSDVASTLAQNKEQHEEEHAISMSDLPPSSTEESPATGPGPDSSQDLRTSTL